MNYILSATITVIIVSISLAIEIGDLLHNNNRLTSFVTYSFSGFLTSLFGVSPLVYYWFNHYCTVIEQLTMSFSFAICFFVIGKMIDQWITNE
jgi:hypothetical protein